MTDRPVFGITVLRYADGRTEFEAADYYKAEDPIDMPEAWQHRHAMLIDACELVKREAGVEYGFVQDEPNANFNVTQPAYDLVVRFGEPIATNPVTGNPVGTDTVCADTDPAFQSSAAIASAEQEGS